MTTSDAGFRTALCKVFESRPSTYWLAACVRLVEAGLVFDDEPVDTPLPPAFLPVWALSQNLVYGAWLVDPQAPTVEVVGMVLDAPKPTAESVGRTGLMLLTVMLEAMSTEDESRVEPMIDLVFRDRSPGQRGALVDAIGDGFDPREVDEIRDLPIIRDVWSDDDLPRATYPAPLSTMFERNASPFDPADYAPAPSRRAAFDAFLAAGDIPRAWAALNDAGWDDAASDAAFEAIAPHIDGDYARLIRANLRSKR